MQVSVMKVFRTAFKGMSDSKSGIRNQKRNRPSVKRINAERRLYYGPFEKQVYHNKNDRRRPDRGVGDLNYFSVGANYKNKIWNRQ